ncbi:formin-like protein 3 isoform X2 [Penaeus chinensis]|uniref:formin-like protein 3 isoform X2 n=1 Tax=Penaeus chinensis TaxID=139456 RepID=UPI001FB655E2|nr:formin-like protein 3 isoform X2 [Penaeus chinensis]
MDGSRRPGTGSGRSHRSPVPANALIELFKEPKNLPHLVDLLRSAFAKGCKIRLHLHSHWRDPRSASSDGILRALQRPSLNETQEWEYYHEPAWKTLTHFTGRVTSPAVLARLVDSIEGLRVAIRSDDEALDWSVSISSCDVFVRLKWIGVHVAAASVDPALLCPLPSLERRPHLYLSGVSDGDVEWASVAAKTLQPRTKEYGIISFPESSFTSKGVEALAKRFSEESVKAREVLVTCDLEGEVTDSFSAQVGCQVVQCQGTEIWTREPAPTPTPEYEDHYILFNAGGGEASQGRGLTGNDQKQETAAEAERESHPYETVLQTDGARGNDSEDIYESISYDHGSLPYVSRKADYIPLVPVRETKQPLPMSAGPREPLPSKYYNSSANSQPRPPMPIPTKLQPDCPSGSLPPKPTLRFPPRLPLKPSLKTRWVKTPRPPAPLPSKSQETQAPKSRGKPPHSRAKASKPPRLQAPVAPQPVMWPPLVYPWASAQPPHTLQFPLCTWPPVSDLQWTPWGMPIQRLVPMAPMLQPCVSWGMQWAPSGGAPSTVTGPVLQHHGVQVSPPPSVSNSLGVHSDQNDEETLYENSDD